MMGDDVKDPFGLRPVWNAILDVYQEFAKLCERHGLTYWVAYGSVLGAVRHKGFIPWDDDFDVLMPREDYDRFWAIAEKELPEHLKIVTWWNTREWNETFGKIQDVRKFVYDRVVRGSGVAQPQGIYIDVFPLDAISESAIKKLVVKVKSRLVLCIKSYMFHKSTRNVRSWIAATLGFVSKFFFHDVRTEKDIVRLQDEIAKSTPSGELMGRYRSDYGGSPWLCRRAVFDGHTLLSFEGMQVPVPKLYEEFLQVNYGDYMKLPPEEKRVPHHGNQGVAPWRFGPTGL